MWAKGPAHRSWESNKENSEEAKWPEISKSDLFASKQTIFQLGRLADRLLHYAVHESTLHENNSNEASVKR